MSSVDRNPQTSEVIVRAANSGATRHSWGLETCNETIEHHSSDIRPGVTSMTGTHRIEVEPADRALLRAGAPRFRSDRQNCCYDGTRRLTRDGTVVRERRWQESIPRDFQ